jgi:HD-like signal output (HDOD) protein
VYTGVTTVQQFTDVLIDDIANNRLEFPTLPEVALRVRKLVEDPKADTNKVSRALSADATLTSRLMQVANSAMFSGMPAVDNIKSAVNRLGLSLVRNMVSCVVMRALYAPRYSAAIKARQQDLWRHSTKVAAFSHALAKSFPKLRRDEAMLAGLIHDIGALPILTRAAKFPDLANDPQKLQAVVDRLHGEIGKLVLQAWHFPDALITVAAEHDDLNRVYVGDPDYADIVMVANLHSYLGSEHRLAKIDWSTLPVFERLKLTPDDSMRVIREAKAEIAAVYSLLGGQAA